VLGRLEQHPLQAEAMRGLDVCTLGDRDPGCVEALCEFVAHALQLPQVEQSGVAASRALWMRNSAHRIRRQEGVGQLTFQPGDLVADRATGTKLLALDIPSRRDL
jgi:hypothetical protein